MAPKTNQNADLYAGKDYQIRFTEAGGADLSAFNEITWVLARSLTGRTVITKTKSGGGITTTGDSNEIAVITLTAADTAGLSVASTYYHELATEDASGMEQVAATGELTFQHSKTND